MLAASNLLYLNRGSYEREIKLPDVCSRDHLFLHLASSAQAA
jgi:hypothetical protein